MAVSNITYATSTGITITLASLASGSARASASIDNSSNRFLDVMLRLRIQLQAGTPSGQRSLNIWFYGSEDGTNFTDNATGADAALTLRNPTNLRGPFIISTPDAGGLAYEAVIGSVANYFGGILPRQWGIVVENQTGIALNATEGNHAKSYTGITLTSV